MAHKKLYLNWYKSLQIENRLLYFRQWRKITINNRKHWCLLDIEEDDRHIKYMLKEIRNWEKEFSLKLV